MASKADSLSDIRFSGGTSSTGDRRRHYVHYEDDRPSLPQRHSGNKDRLITSSILAVGLVAGAVYALSATSTPPLTEDALAPEMTSSWQEDSNVASSYALTTIATPGQAAATDTPVQTPVDAAAAEEAGDANDPEPVVMEPSSASPVAPLPMGEARRQQAPETRRQQAPEARRQLAPEAPPGSEAKAPPEAPVYPDPVKTPPDLAASPDNPY